MSVVQGQADSWGAPAASAATTARAAPAHTVRDDWDDEEEEQEEQDPQKLWEEANKRTPMPELVIAGSSTSNSAVSPPPEAFQPVLRILKRPTATATLSSSSTPTPDPDANSYAAREARYQAARERIFGDSSPTPDQQTANSKTGPKKAVASVQIAREPKGPPTIQSGTSPGGTDQGGDARGFSSRRGKRRGGASGKS